MRWRIDWLTLFVGSVIFGVGLFLGSRYSAPRALEGSASERLRAVSSTPAGAVAAKTVYVPVYSSIYLGLNTRKPMVDLAATVSVRNVSAMHPLIIEEVRYFDSAGKPVRDYVKGP